MPFLSSIEVVDAPDSGFPFELTSIQQLRSGLKLHPKVTFLVGENGTGKSTILEAIADKWGFDDQSGNRSRSPNLREYQTELARYVRISRLHRPLDGFFLRAESFFNFAAHMDEMENDPFSATGYFNYGGKSLLEQSHGESFLSLFLNRFGEHGLYLLDEPEAALSPARQLTFLVRLHDLVESDSQFIIATHSPIIMAYPDAWIYQLSENGIERVEYQETQHVDLTRRFLNNRKRMLDRLLSPTDDDDTD
ncbi:MAG: AAA family ATPase [Verrucomicrobiae bacterium]|nr:AAA family ATPase [Verrucomicrobiae bacterium]